MEDSEGEPGSLAVLLVCKSDSIRERLCQKVESYFPKRSKIESFSSLSGAIESLEATPASYQLALIEQEGQGVVLLKAIFGLLPGAVIGVVSENPEPIAGLSSREWSLEFLDPSDVESGLYRILKKSSALGRLPPPEILEQQEFIAIAMKSLSGLTPLQSDVYSRIRKDHYVCVFKKGSILEEGDLKKFIDSNRTEFHVKASEVKASLDQVRARLDEGTNASKITLEHAKHEFVATHSLLRDVVGQLGFTPEAQAIAKSCVNMALKALGSKPKLSEILEDLKRKEGAYIPAHSFMIGNVACALAHRIGWSSSATFFKLSLAAFLHDIPLASEKHARIQDLSGMDAMGLESEEIKLIRLHPIRASEYSRQFAEIPSDVDIIISQHHESPEGNGFPRGMPGKLISPLSALFIMAQDLVHAVVDDPETRFEDFFKMNSARYEVGQFRKILGLMVRD